MKKKRPQRMGNYRGLYDLLSEKEYEFLKWGEGKNLFVGYSNVYKIKSDINKKVKALSVKKVQRLLDQLFCLMYKNQNYEELMNAFAEILIKHDLTNPMFEEKYAKLKEVDNKRISDILAEKPLMLTSDRIEKFNYAEENETYLTFTKILKFIRSKKKYRFWFSRLINHKNWVNETFQTKFRGEANFLTKLVKFKLLSFDYKTKCYKKTVAGNRIIDLYVNKYPNVYKSLTESTSSEK